MALRQQWKLYLMPSTIQMGGFEMKKKTNKTQEVLKHLQKRGSITSWDAIMKYGATRLSAIIFNLRERGYLIDSIYMDGKDKYGNTSHYVKYVYKGVING